MVAHPLSGVVFSARLALPPGISRDPAQSSPSCGSSAGTGTSLREVQGDSEHLCRERLAATQDSAAQTSGPLLSWDSASPLSPALGGHILYKGSGFVGLDGAMLPSLF